MPDVPDTNNFSLQDVVDSVVPSSSDLVDCFNDATGTFDPAYVGAKDRLSNFRNYKDIPACDPSFLFCHDFRLGLGVFTLAVAGASLVADGLRITEILANQTVIATCNVPITIPNNATLTFRYEIAENSNVVDESAAMVLAGKVGANVMIPPSGSPQAFTTTQSQSGTSVTLESLRVANTNQSVTVTRVEIYV
jgi:hypothetical protein